MQPPGTSEVFGPLVVCPGKQYAVAMTRSGSWGWQFPVSGKKVNSSNRHRVALLKLACGCQPGVVSDHILAPSGRLRPGPPDDWLIWPTSSPRRGPGGPAWGKLLSPPPGGLVKPRQY
jgi:hypothetical protein